MKSFRNFLIEESKAFNIAIVNPEDFDLIPNPIQAPLDKMKELLKKFGDISDVPIAGQQTGEKFKIRVPKGDEEKRSEISAWAKENGVSQYIAFGNGSIGSGGAKISENTQEIMTACIVLMNQKNIKQVKHPDTNDLIVSAQKKFDSVVGSKDRKELLGQFVNNYNDLATAISSSNAILDIVGTARKVFWVGKTWDSEISPFNPPMGNIRDYNSSDIVVLGTDGIYYGFSLKKKSTKKAQDPTLINKPITGSRSFLKGLMSDQDLTKIEDAKYSFFDSVIMDHYNKTKRELKKIKDKDKTKLIGQISQSKMGTYLKSKKNKFFKTADKIILSGGGSEFAVAFLEQIFRTKLSEVESAGKFKFYLLTGIGQNGSEQLSVDSADVQDLPSTMEVVSKLIDEGLTVKRTSKKKQAWDEGTNAAKIFHTIYAGNKPIVNIEVRYKGSYTANPQFQATATPNFKNLFGK